MAPKEDSVKVSDPRKRDQTRSRAGDEGDAKNERPRHKIDIDHALLLECIEDSGINPDFASMAHRRGITKDAMRMRYNEFRASIYAATTVPDDSKDTPKDAQKGKAKSGD